MNNSHFKTGFVLGAAAAGAAATIMYMKRSKLRREFFKLRLRADVYKRLADLRRITRRSYEDVIDDAVARHRAVMDIGEDELEELSGELKQRYAEVKRRFSHVVDTIKDAALKDEDEE